MEFQIYTEEDRKEYIKFVGSLKLPIKSKVDQILPKRTPAQNRYGHKILTMYANHIGWTVKDLKEKMQKDYLLVEEIKNNEGVFSVVRSTADLDVVEWEYFMEQVKKDAWDNYHYYLPEPNEVIDDSGELKVKLLK